MIDRAQAARKAAEGKDVTPNERSAWLAAAAAWDTLQLPKPKLSERGKQLAALYTLTRSLATVQSAEPKPERPTESPKSPEPEPIKPTPTGAFAAIEF